MTPGEKFGHSIRCLRLISGFTQEEVANSLQISQTNLRRIELGHGNPRYNTVTDLVNFLATKITGVPQKIELFKLDEFVEELIVWRYRLVPETAYREEIGWFPTFGIMVEERWKGEWKVREDQTIHDVMLDGARATELVAQLNEYHVSPLHLWEILEDLL